MKSFLRTLLLLLLFAGSARAQDFLGFSNSNWSGITGIYYNPANIADNRMKFDMDLFGMNMYFANNYIGMKHEALKRDKSYLLPGGEKIPFVKHMRAFEDPDFQKNYLTERNNDDP